MVEPTDADIKAALAWQRAHPEIAEQYCGQWVALGPKSVLAHGEDLKVVLAEAKRRGFAEPLLWKVPPRGILALWWLGNA